MKTGIKGSPSPLPSMGMIVLISVVFVIPLMLWGNHWPWLGLVPFGLIVIATVRGEIQRLRNAQYHWNRNSYDQVVEVKFVPAIVENRDFFSEEDEWECVVGSEISEQTTGNVIRLVGQDKFRKVSDERFAAIA